MAVKAGNLDQRITIEAATRTPDGAGGMTKAWATLDVVWAGVTPRVGNEVLSEGRTSATGTYSFTIRSRSDVDETQRIVWLGEVYNIRNVMRTGGRELYLVIDAERGVAT